METRSNDSMRLLEDKGIGLNSSAEITNFDRPGFEFMLK